MKVLVVLSQPPIPEGGAPARCAIGLLRGLRQHGVDVRAVAASQHFALPGEPPQDLAVEVVPVRPTHGRLHANLDRLRRPRGELARGEFAAAVRTAARDVDVVHLEETETAWCDLGVQKPALVHVHYLVRRDRPFGAPWRKEFREVVEFACGERAAIRRHRHLVASSPDVAGILRARRPGADVVLAPLSLDPDLYPQAPLDGPPTVGVIGTAAWPPTAAAMRRLVERVWPEIRRRVPSARLLVAGRGVEALRLPAVPGVEIVGAVSSAVDFLHGLSALVYPLERGSGMKVKVLESIAVGLPVVTTPAGAEGIDGDEGVAVASSDDELAGLATDLLHDSAARRERGAAARRAFERRYSPTPATRPLVELYARMAA